MITVQHLTKDFGHIRAVNDISFEVRKGTVLGFLGPNGAGKTTAIRMIAGYLPPSSGTAVVNGCDVTVNPVNAQKQIGYLPENAPLYEDMTVENFLRFAAEMRGFMGENRDRRVDELIETCFLTSVRYQTIDTLSKGYRQRTCFAQALLHDPPVLLLDEPTEGLDPNQKQVVRKMITSMGKEKIIMLSTHVLEEVEAICSRVIIISRGKIVADSTPEQMKKRSEAYNVLNLRVVAPREEVVETFAQVRDVERVDLIASENDTHLLRLTPHQKQPLATAVIDIARNRNWLVTDMQTNSGNLDDVFRRITITEDVAETGSPTA